MPRVCHLTGVKTVVGNKLRYRGRPKYLGGIGLNRTSKSKRTFKPNLQTVTALVDGRPRKIRVSTKAIKNGMVVKPLKRKYGYTSEQKAAEAN